MDNDLDFVNSGSRNQERCEFYLRFGTSIFDVFFLNLPDARNAAERIAAATRQEVEIFQKETGAIVERFSPSS